MEGKNRHQYSSLDGVRGLAAVSVVLLHYTTAFAPFLIGYVATKRHSPFDHIISTTPLQLPVAGSFGVAIFFVLSGFVLSLSFFKRKDHEALISSAARRYFRLMLPALGSVIVAYLVLRFDGMHNVQTVRFTESSNWLNQFWYFPAHLSQAVYQGLYGAYVNGIVTYNPVLWTIQLEMLGSFVVFMFLALFGKVSNRWFFYILFSLFFLKSYYLAFIVGVAISDVFTNFQYLTTWVSNKVIYCLLPISIILGAWPDQSIYTSFYDHIHIPTFSIPEAVVFAHIVAAIIAIVAVLKLQILKRFFETKPLQYLGRISYSLYLLHFIIMGSLACYLFDTVYPHLGYSKSLVLSFVPSIAVTLVASSLYTKYVDDPAIAYAKRIGNILVGQPLITGTHIAQLASKLFPEKLPTEKLTPVPESIVNEDTTNT